MYLLLCKEKTLVEYLKNNEYYALYTFVEEKCSVGIILQ